VLKDAAPAELMQAIEVVHRGGAFFSPKVAGALLRAVGSPLPRSRADPSRLAGRERDVLALIITGLANKAIAARLGVTFATVKTLRGRIMRKLDLHSVAELTQFALAHGITDVADAPPRAR
jgi:DNA-binding NarL/FixJ family response regulator